MMRVRFHRGGEERYVQDVFGGEVGEVPGRMVDHVGESGRGEEVAFCNDHTSRVSLLLCVYYKIQRQFQYMVISRHKVVAKCLFSPVYGM